MKVMYKAAVLTLATAFLPNGVGAAKLYKCVNENGETTYKQTPCANDSQQKVLENKTENRNRETHDAKLPENKRADGENMAALKKRLSEYGDRAMERMKSSPEEAIKGGYAVAGMTKSQVRTAMGGPTSVFGPDYSAGAASEMWTYERPGLTESVFFTSGKVTSMSGNLY